MQMSMRLCQLFISHTPRCSHILRASKLIPSSLGAGSSGICSFSHHHLECGKIDLRERLSQDLPELGRAKVATHKKVEPPVSQTHTQFLSGSVSSSHRLILLYYFCGIAVCATSFEISGLKPQHKRIKTIQSPLQPRVTTFGLLQLFSGLLVYFLQDYYFLLPLLLVSYTITVLRFYF